MGAPEYDHHLFQRQRKTKGKYVNIKNWFTKGYLTRLSSPHPCWLNKRKNR